MASQKLTTEMKKEINILYDAGSISTELAIKYGVTPPTICSCIINIRAIGTRKGKKKTRKKGTPEMIAKIKKLKDEGEKVDYIARICKVDASSIYNWLKEVKCS